MTMDALHMFRDHRWVGTGLGSYETVSPRYQNVLPQRIVDHAHNDFAEWMAETGIAGLVLALVGLAIFFVTAFGNLKSKFDELGGCIRLGAAVGCCGVLVHSFSDFNLHIPANAAWFAVAAAISQLPVSARANENTARFANTTS
jgi:O-antigen ligase